MKNKQKPKYKKPIQAPQSKKIGLVILLVIGILLFLPQINAWEWDDRVTGYDETKRELTITNALGLGSDIAKIRHTNYNPYNTYCIPDECYMYLDSDLFHDDVRMITGVKYLYENGSEKNAGKSKFEYYNSDASYQVPKYEQVCGDETLNGTLHKNFCRTTQKGTETKYGLWEEYNLNSLSDIKNYKFRIKIDIKEGERLDVVPEIMGKYIYEWAWYDGLTALEWNNITYTNQNTIYASNYAAQTLRLGNVSTLGVDVFGISHVTMQVKRILKGSNNCQIMIKNWTSGVTPTFSDVNISTSPIFNSSEVIPTNYVNMTFNLTYTYGAKKDNNLTIMWYCDGGDATNHIFWTYTTPSVYGGGGSDVMYTSWTTSGDADFSNNRAAYNNIDFDFALWGTTTLLSATFVYPTATIYNTLVDELNYTHVNGDYCWYSTDGGTTNSSTISCGTNFTSVSSVEGSNTWTLYVNNTIDDMVNTTKTFTVDTIAPKVNLTMPSFFNYTYQGLNISFDWMIYDAGTLDSCWTEYNGTNRTEDCGKNTSTFIYDWRANNITLWVNDTVDNLYGNNSNYSSYNHLNNWNSYNDTGYATSTQRFLINITTNGTTPTSAKLVFNSTEYSTTVTSIGGNNYTLTSNISIPVISATTSAPFNFTWYLGSGTQFISTDTNNQTIKPSIFHICNASHTIDDWYVTYTFQDEADSSYINASLGSSTFYYWIGDGDVKQSYTYLNTTENFNYTFCFKPQNRSITVNYNISYYSTGYPQRTTDFPNLALNNDTTNISLQLLASGSGLYVTFQVINQAEQPLNNVFVNATRSIGGVPTLVDDGFTGADGGVTFWLNPDFLHTFSFDAVGYALYITALSPTQSSYTIQLGSAITINATDYQQGVSYTIRPREDYLYNETVYSFNFTITSSYWTIDKFGFNLKNNSGYLIGAVSSTANGGTVNLDRDVGNNTEIIMNYYWVIEGNYSNASRMWMVYDSEGSGWGIKTFFNDLILYTDDDGELFGLDDFGKSLIIFLIILTLVGIMSFKYGLVSPAAIMSMIFGLVLFFDVGVGLIPNPVGAVAYFPTIFMAIVLLGVLISEAIK